MFKVSKPPICKERNNLCTIQSEMECIEQLPQTDHPVILIKYGMASREDMQLIRELLKTYKKSGDWKLYEHNQADQE